jgi:hypothetical protein
MWGRKRQKVEGDKTEPPRTPGLKEAVREARIEAAERTGVVVDLRDAELARLELLNDAIEPLFAEVPTEIELFDRAVSRGDTPRLWIDAIAHIHMGRDKRQYRFVQDTRYGRRVLAESYEIPEIVEAVTKYVARRVVERERALGDDATLVLEDLRREAKFERRWRRRRALKAFLFGIFIGLMAVFLVLFLIAAKTAR